MGLLAVANQAQGSDVAEVALSAAFRDRQNVIGVSQRPRLVHVAVRDLRRACLRP